MRYGTPIFFQKVAQGEYDPTTGDYGSDMIEETKRYANVNSAGAETLNIVYGELRLGSMVVRLQTYYDEPFDRIRIGRKVYRVDFSRKFKTKHVFVMSEVQ